MQNGRWVLLTLFTRFNGPFLWTMFPFKKQTPNQPNKKKIQTVAFGNKILIKPTRQHHSSILHELNWWTVEHNSIKKKGAL